jgi:putative 4-mercaptohistidine N1-methyltranferase
MTLSTIASLAYSYLVHQENKALKQNNGQIPANTSEEAGLEHGKPLETRMYEQEKALNEYLLLHYGENLSGKFKDEADVHGNTYPLDIATVSQNYGDFGFFNVDTDSLEAPRYPTYALNFPARVAKLAAHFAPTGGDKCALDVGCAVGRTAIELSPYFGKVLGIDYSNSFIDAARKLANNEKLSFTAPIEGSVRFEAVAEAGAHTVPSRVQFEQGDATCLATDVKHDCITAANLIDRLPCPRAFLRSLPEITAQGGVVVLTSPYTWLRDFTPEEEWLVSAEQPSTFEALKEIMLENFELVHQSHMPFLIRETARKNQFTFAHATVWRRK